MLRDRPQFLSAGSPQNRPTVVTSKPVQRKWCWGEGCFTPTLPVEARLFSCAKSVDQFQYVVRMREAMEHGGNGSTIAEKLTPFVDRSIRQAKCWRAHSGALRF